MMNNSEARKRYNEYKELFNKACDYGFDGYFPAPHDTLPEKTEYLKAWLADNADGHPTGPTGTGGPSVTAAEMIVRDGGLADFAVSEANRCNSTNRDFQCILDKHSEGNHTAYDIHNLKVTWSQPMVAYTTPRRLAEVPF